MVSLTVANIQMIVVMMIVISVMFQGYPVFLLLILLKMVLEFTRRHLTSISMALKSTKTVLSLLPVQFPFTSVTSQHPQLPSKTTSPKVTRKPS